MSDTQNFAFGQFVPGFDFLQNLAKGASQAMPQMPNLSSWVAPTLNVEDLEKRIGELRAVHFWLEQNSRALSATIQALEVQKMTLATLKGMNFSLADLASAMQVKPAEAAASASAPAAAPTPAPAPAAASAEAAAPAAAAAGSQGDKPAPASGMVDPLQWWSSLTHQFQSIASQALQEAAQHPGGEVVRSMADAAGQAMKTAARMTGAATGVPSAAPAPARQATGKTPVRKASARKPASQRTAAAKTARKTTASPRSRT